MRCGWLPAMLLFLAAWMGPAARAVHAAPAAHLPALWAAEAPAADESEKAEEGEGQVNIFKPSAELFVWTIVVFILLLIILGRYAWGPMLEGLHKREQSIQSAIDDARKAREEAQQLQNQWHQEMARAQDKVREIHEEARKRAEQNANEIQARARSEIQSERDRLRREIDTAKDQALQELWSQTAQLATVVSSKVLRRQLTTDDHRRLVDEALGEIGQAENNRKRTEKGLA
ncbi:MAG: F0F1 ATP synthase subunit B [Planctomycetes bacterium]|nr:F0F1 ATP synthase subunit B [Planctomycetota bacterium]